MSKKKQFFQYAVLGHMLVNKTEDKWETEVLVEPVTILAAGVDEVQMKAIRSISDENVEKYGAENIQICTRPF
jgi:hypothetical protein